MAYARWATKDEVAENCIAIDSNTMIEKGGIPLMYDKEHLYIDQMNFHNLIIGSTGSGKTQTCILPALKFSMLAGESFVVNDTKGELYKKMASKLEAEGYEVVAIDFDNNKYGNSWNPLLMSYQIYKKGEKDIAIKLLEDIGYYFFYDSKEMCDSFWTNSVIDYFTGLTLYLFEYAKEDEINLNSVYNLSSEINEGEKYLEFLDRIKSNSSIYGNLSVTLKAPLETRGSILSVFNQKIKKYVTKENISNMLSFSDFDIFEISNKKCALFIISGYSDYCSKLIPLLLSQIISGVNLNGKQEKILHIVLDEFDSIVPVKDFYKVIEDSRSISIKFTVAIKSYEHLWSMYKARDEVELLKLSFGNIIYLLCNDWRTAEEISRYCGMELVDDKTRLLISREELRTLDMFNAVIVMQRMMPFKTELLPDYKIEWPFEFKQCEIPIRENKKINIYTL